MSHWSLDPAHSELQFKVRHLGISNVTGSFSALTGTIESTDATFASAKVNFSTDTASINTNNEGRDQHLKSVDFFDAEAFPTITFQSTTFDASAGKIAGELTIKGITRAINFDVEFHGTEVDPWGNTKAGFSFETKIKRSDFGLTWNATLETGGLLVSEDVKILGEIQFTKSA